MKRFFLLPFLAMSSLSVFSQEAIDSVPLNDTLAVANNVSSTTSSGTTILDYLIGISILAAALFIVGHMVYTLFKTKQFAGQDFSVDFFKSFRKEKGMVADSTDEENEKCSALLNDAFLIWSNIEEDDEGNEYRKPKKMKEILQSGEILKQVVEIAPTNEDVVKVLNEYKEVVTTNEARSFDGSWKLVGLGVAVAILLSLISMDAMGGFFSAFFSIGMYFIVPSIIYIISSYTPQFLIEKRANRGGGNVSTGLVAVAMGVLGSGVTVRTKYTDGTHEDDHSGHFIAWILGLVMMVIVAFTIIIWSFINYLRNYVLFF